MSLNDMEKTYITETGKPQKNNFVSLVEVIYSKRGFVNNWIPS